MSLRTLAVGFAVPLGLLACSASSGPEVTGKSVAAITSLKGQLKSQSGFCLDVYANNQNSGASVDIASCNGTTAQTFTFTPGTPGPIVNTASGLCLDDVWGGGQAMEMVTCMGTPEQTWTISGLPMVAKVVNSYGHCMDVLGNRQANGQTVDPASCNGTTAQLWAYNLPCPPGEVNGALGACYCDRTSYDVQVSSQLFYDLVAPQLSGMDVHFANGNLNVTLPAGLGITNPQPIPVNIPGVTINSLDMPSGYAPGSSWTWAVSTDSATITVSTTLAASISGTWSGVWGVGACGVTANILFAPVNIVLSNPPGTSNLQVQSVSVPLQGLSRGQGNTTTSGCSAIPQDDILGQFQSQIQSALKTQLNGIAFMNQVLNGVVQTMANQDHSALGLPDAMPPGGTWVCDGGLVTGAITGACNRQCP